MINDKELESKVKVLCEVFILLDAFNYVKKNNPSNDLPYHNWYHALCMVEKCLEGAIYHNLPYRSMRHLTLAALFHDYDHTGGKEADSTNISRAIWGWRKYDALSNCSLANIDAMEVEHIIKITEYPYTSDPISIEQKIIRDADLMQCLRPTWHEMIIDGLRKELSIKFGKELTEEEMCEGQIKFLDAVKPHSEWGKDVLITKNGIGKAKYNITLLLCAIDSEKVKT